LQTFKCTGAEAKGWKSINNVFVKKTLLLQMEQNTLEILSVPTEKKNLKDSGQHVVGLYLENCWPAYIDTNIFSWLRCEELTPVVHPAI
jgi:hypothetical protein